MERQEFEHIRDLPGKQITGPIKLQRRPSHEPEVAAFGIPITNSDDLELCMDVSYNPETDKKKVNIRLKGVGAICRLDVDGPPHRDVPGSHKHSLQEAACPRRNLPKQVIERTDLNQKTVQEVLDEMCRLGKIAGAPRVELPTP